MQGGLENFRHRWVGGLTDFNSIALLTWLLQRLLAKFTLAVVFVVLFLSFNPVKAELDSTNPVIRIGITPVILFQKSQFLQKWKLYLETQLKHSIEFVQQDSYGKITTLLLRGELDFAWICGYPYVQHQAQLELLAVPLYEGKPLYHSYLIVSSRDTKTGSFHELKDKVFAYSDPDSNSGYLYAQYRLKKAKLNPTLFFKKTFYTWQHKNTIEAVAVGLADAGIIDSYIWETMKRQKDPLIAKTRIAEKSKKFGFPPIVSTKYTPAHLKRKLQSILLAMSSNIQGKYLLHQLNIDGFTKGNHDLYDDILQMHLFIKANNHVSS